LFCGGSFFCPLCFCQAHKIFYHQKSGYYLQIKHNRRFLPQSEQFCLSWFFLVFVSPKNLAKEKEKNEIKKCVIGVNM
jgi:hypothetical protein